MNRFKDMGITAPAKGFTGDKIKIDRVLNREITVHDYKIKPSKHGDGKCLYLQISLGENKHVLFTGSTGLLDMIQQVPQEKFPFITTIVRENERYEFT